MANAACASPTAHAAMPSRPESSADSAMVNPWPSSPIRRSTPTRAPSRSTWAVVDALNPIFRSGRAAETPGVSAGTSSVEIPCGPSSDVRTMTL